MLFSAVQGLSEKLDGKDGRIEDLQAKADRVDELETENEHKEARIDELQERLAMLEVQVGSTGLATADD